MLYGRWCFINKVNLKMISSSYQSVFLQWLRLRHCKKKYEKVSLKWRIKNKKDKGKVIQKIGRLCLIIVTFSSHLGLKQVKIQAPLNWINQKKHKDPKTKLSALKTSITVKRLLSSLGLPPPPPPFKNTHTHTLFLLLAPCYYPVKGKI